MKLELTLDFDVENTPAENSESLESIPDPTKTEQAVAELSQEWLLKFTGLNRVGDEFIVNSDLQLLIPHAKYANELFALIRDNREYLSQFMHWPRFVNTVADSHAFLMSSLGDFGVKNAIFLVRYQGEIAGTISYNKFDLNEKVGYFGYWLAPRFQGKGIISTCLRAMETLCPSQLQNFVILAGVDNKQSNEVAIRNGYQFVEVVPNAEFIGDHYIDDNKYLKAL